MFIEASLTDEDTATLLVEYPALVLEPYGLMFRKYIMNHGLYGVVELGQRKNCEADQELILVWLRRYTR